MASMMTYVSTATFAVMHSVRLLGLQLLKFVPTPEPVKVVVLLFLIRGKLEDLRKRKEEINERGAAPVDLPVFWIKQTVRLAGAAD